MVKRNKSLMIPDGWIETKLGEVVEIASSKRIYADEYLASGIPFYRGKEIIEKYNGNNVSTELFISKVKFNEIKERFGVPKPGDILLTSVGTLGIPYIVQENEDFYFKDGNLTWFKHYNGIDNKFLFYWFISDFGKEQLMKNTIGSTQQALTIVALNSLPILLPPLSQQKEIADILSSLDNKIELLREENKTLEAIAQTIFKEWFVNFNFPDENGKPYKSSGGKMIDSKLGEIPEGWRIGKICEILELNYGKALREEDRIAGSYPVFGSSGIIGTNKEYLINGPGIIVGRKGSIGTIFWSNESFYPIDTTFYVKDKIGFQDLYFHYFLLKKQDFENRGSDSAVPGLNRNSVYSIHIVMPDKEIIQRFSAFVKEIFNKKMYVCIQIQTLSDLHCLLLPRLIKGETRIIGY